MNKEEEKRKKFHDALLNMLYPPPSPQEQNHNEQPKTKIFNPTLDNISGNFDELEDMEKSSSSDDEGEDESSLQKLSRSQRKRVRKKRLKEAKSQRRKIIGPLLPSGNDDGGRDEEHENIGLQDVRRIVSQKNFSATGESSGVVCIPRRSKRAKRRLAKKVGDDKGKSNGVEVEIYENGPKTNHDKEEEISDEEKQGVECVN